MGNIKVAGKTEDEEVFTLRPEHLLIHADPAEVDSHLTLNMRKALKELERSSLELFVDYIPELQSLPFGVVDAEYEELPRVMKVQDKSVKVKQKVNIQIGVIYKGLYVYAVDTTIIKLINFLMTAFPDERIILYTHNADAELSSHACQLLQELEQFNIQFKIKQRNSKMVIFAKGKSKIVIVDSMNLFGKQKLDKICQTFNGWSPKEILAKLGIEHDDKLVKNLYRKGGNRLVALYNQHDCVATALAIYNFTKGIKRTAEELGLELNDKESKVIECPTTIGQIASLLVRKLEQKLGYSLIKEFRQVEKCYQVRDRLTNKYDIIRKLLTNCYYGGGLIYADTDFTEVKGYLYDFISLYPTAGIISAKLLPRSYDNIDAVILESNEQFWQLVNDKSMVAFLPAHVKYKSSFRCLIPKKRHLRNRLKKAELGLIDEQDDLTYRIVYAEEADVMLPNFYIRSHLHDYDFEPLIGNCVLIWKCEGYPVMREWFIYNLTKKNQYDKIDRKNPMREIHKMLANISYGKSVEKAEDGYVPSLFCPPIGIMITWVSKLIMELTIRYCNEHNVKVYQTATDSLKVNQPIDQEALRLYLNEQLQKLGLDPLTPEIFPRILTDEGNGHTLTIKMIRGKFTVELDEQGNVVHKAHHGFILPEYYKENNYAKLVKLIDEIIKNKQEGKEVVYICGVYNKVGKKQITKLIAKDRQWLNLYGLEVLQVRTLLPLPSGYVNPWTGENFKNEDEANEYHDKIDRAKDKLRRKLQEKIDVIYNNWVFGQDKEIWEQIKLTTNLEPLYKEGQKVFIKIIRAQEGNEPSQPTEIRKGYYKEIEVDGQIVNSRQLYNEITTDGKMRLVVRQEIIKTHVGNIMPAC